MFRPADPFPLLNLECHSLAELKAHAAAADAWLGLKATEVESLLLGRGSRAKAPRTEGQSGQQQLWFGLEVQSLMTPYCELRALLERLQPKPGDKIIDMGAAYGRMGFIIERHFPGVDFVGYEYVGERVGEAKRLYQRHKLKRARVEHVDLARPGFIPEEAQIYFIYDYGSLKAIEKSLYDLRRLSEKSALTLVARGRHCRYLIDSRHGWLSNAFPGEAEGRYTIYRSDLAREKECYSVKARMKLSLAR